MQIYLINLDKDKDRLAIIDLQLKKLGINYERFSAIYAKDISKEELNKYVNRFRWWCCMGRKILPGEVGCALSHYSIYRTIINKGINYACILEDDIIINENFKERICKIEKWIDINKPQVILLSNYTNEIEDIEEIRKVNSGLCTDAYIITKKAAKALLKENYPICVPCDHWGRWFKNKSIDLYMALPHVAKQNWDDFESNMAESKLFNKRKNIFHMLVYKAKRLIGLTIDKVLSLFEHL